MDHRRIAEKYLRAEQARTIAEDVVDGTGCMPYRTDQAAVVANLFLLTGQARTAFWGRKLDTTFDQTAANLVPELELEVTSREEKALALLGRLPVDNLMNEITSY